MISKPVASEGVDNGDQEKRRSGSNENGIEHDVTPRLRERNRDWIIPLSYKSSR